MSWQLDFHRAGKEKDKERGREGSQKRAQIKDEERQEKSAVEEEKRKSKLLISEAFILLLVSHTTKLSNRG